LRGTGFSSGGLRENAFPSGFSVSYLSRFSVNDKKVETVVVRRGDLCYANVGGGLSRHQTNSPLRQSAECGTNRQYAKFCGSRGLR